ncbi:tyrosine-type recombinase/integrase [Amycolatopsis sp. FU40]|uniref:site-specific integrase n=1 Tax=Amycolatopsis sp. FU40 TaxID=2914159 RepID=UPI001F0320CA|nr:tyrosine-type recombinase/integrase [Amycolatopsis sp. FU40]UKD53672.1 tyrosine-type recombinase/integrase [Amycolatopsis sp. FU40]
MARPSLPVGTYGKISSRRNGSSYMASANYRDLDGAVRKVRAWAETKTKAENKLRERLRDRQARQGHITADTKVVTVGELWLNEFRAEVDLGNRSGSSLDTYENRWMTHVKPRVIGLSIGELHAGRIDTILQDINRKLSASSAKTARTILSSICGYAVRHEAIKINPVRDARPVENRKGGKKRKPTRALEVNEALEIFRLADNDEVAVRQDLPDIMRFYAGTGERTGEAIAIRWEHIDFDKKIARMEGNFVRTKADGAHVSDGKTENAQRDIALTDWLVTLLLDRRARVAALQGIRPEDVTGWVFPNSKGGLREANNLRRDWRAFRDRHHLGDWFTPRTFRRTVATIVTDALPARYASDLLGHSQVAQTYTYVGRKAPSRRPAEVLRVLDGRQKRQ